MTSALDELYKQLPIWIVSDWSELTDESMKLCPIRPNPSAVTNYVVKW